MLILKQIIVLQLVKSQIVIRSNPSNLIQKKHIQTLPSRIRFIRYLIITSKHKNKHPFANFRLRLIVEK